MTERVCAWQECGLPLVQRRNEPNHKFKIRETCCASHASKLGMQRYAGTRGATPERQCGWCGNPFVKRDSEKPNHFRVRLTCSRACGWRLGKQTQSGVKKGRGVVGEEPLPQGEYHPWPAVTGEVDWQNAFAAHNLSDPDGGRRLVMMKPAAHVPSASSCAVAAL